MSLSVHADFSSYMYGDSEYAQAYSRVPLQAYISPSLNGIVIYLLRDSTFIFSVWVVGGGFVVVHAGVYPHAFPQNITGLEHTVSTNYVIS